MLFKDVPLRTRRALSLYKVYADSALLVLKGISLISVSTLLALSRRYDVQVNLNMSSQLLSWCAFIIAIRETCRYRFHEVAALRALMHAAQPLRENGDDVCTIHCIVYMYIHSGNIMC